MVSDNLLYATTTLRSSVTSLKKKLSNIKVSLVLFDAELDKIDTRLDNVSTQAEVYKSKLERELGREIRRLEKELATLRKSSGSTVLSDSSLSVPDSENNIASTIGIFDTILRLICDNADDFRLASEAFLFPAIYERVASCEEEAYFLNDVPAAATTVIARGREYVEWIREEYDTHLTDPDTWKEAIDYVKEWWANDALPMIYGARDEQWDIDVPLSLQEMLLWRDSPGDRPLNFTVVFDAYEIYRKHKDVIYESTGLREFELKQFVNKG